MHLVLTDSGLGGLTICAAIERALRGRSGPQTVRLTYVNAWPEEGWGYNDLPGAAARAEIFDRALRRMAAMQPDGLLIACNTLSIVYEQTVFRREATLPVTGIVEAGVELFREALAASPAGALLLLGTRTTIDSGTHRNRLLREGVSRARVGAASCHGLAAAIERGPGSEETSALIERCATQGGEAAPAGEPLFAGLCCTHYAMVAGRLSAALARRTRRPVVPLDPNARLVDHVLAQFFCGGEPGTAALAGPTVEVISKVALKDEQRAAVAALLEPISPATAEALRQYEHVPDLF